MAVISLGLADLALAALLLVLNGALSLLLQLGLGRSLLIAAVRMVVDRHWPALRAVTPENSLDGKLIAAKLAELETFEARIAKLEEASAND